ncbi:MAG TPA: hypothetical protein VN638_03025, partial [Nitrospiraceae bacterium]|nr:hypothetical protein [Nitrospiraceae bacterium]
CEPAGEPDQRHQAAQHRVSANSCRSHRRSPFLPVSECHQLPAFEQGTETGKEKSRGKTRGAASFFIESIPDASARAFRDTGPLPEKSTGGAKEKLVGGGRWQPARTERKLRS